MMKTQINNIFYEPNEDHHPHVCFLINRKKKKIRREKKTRLAMAEEQIPCLKEICVVQSLTLNVETLDDHKSIV